MYTALIILNYNNYEDTLNCIDSIDKYNTAPVKYIIIDNGSTREQTVKKLNSELEKRYGGNYQLLNSSTSLPSNLAKVTLFDSGTNDGYACGNNKGVALAKKDPKIKYIMILNNDVLFVEDIITSLIDTLRSIPDCAIVSPVLYKKGLTEIDYNCARKEYSISEIISNNFLHYWYKTIRRPVGEKRHILKRKNIKIGEDIIDIELPSGSCMLSEKDYFCMIGAFDPNTFLYYEEDILWQKIRKTGKRNYIDTRYKCIHLGAHSTKSEPNAFLHKTVMKSRSYFVKEYLNVNRVTYWLYLLSERFFDFSYKIQKGLNLKL